jgi:hypothetical protein
MLATPPQQIYFIAKRMLPFAVPVDEKLAATPKPRRWHSTQQSTATM